MFQNESTILSLKEILRTHLWLKLLISMALGVCIGFVLLRLDKAVAGTWPVTIADWLALPGSLYLTIIQMVIIPLILSSIILALADVSQKANIGKIASTAGFFIVIATCIAAFVGIMVITIFEPGVAIQESARSLGQIEVSQDVALKITPQTVLKLVPVNPLASLLNGDLLEVLIVAIIFGLVIAKMDRSKSGIILEAMAGTQTLCMTIIAWTAKLAPYAIFGLMIRAVVNSGLNVLFGMLGYLLCAFAGFIIMILLYLIWVAIIGRNPWVFLKQIKEPLVLAFSLSSSAATMPTTLKTAKEELKISPEVAELLIPLGTTCNMAGSALWQSSATFFLAQAFGGDVDLPTMLTIVVLTVGASVGTPGVPGAGVGVLNTTLRTVGVPAAGIPLILGVDRLVDMGSTVINVFGDLVLCTTAQWRLDKKEKNS